MYGDYDDFIVALNAYEGDNVWEDVIWGSTVDGDEIDHRETMNRDDDVIVFLSGAVISFSPSAKKWESSLSEV